ncbi:hypothetical protein LPJ72_005098 [Coemansia sp. Benny D160-2]|nr:hypothetical protein LPJ72_005098 [Coemansia sp. Benny D160-2]
MAKHASFATSDDASTTAYTESAVPGGNAKTVPVNIMGLSEQNTASATKQKMKNCLQIAGAAVLSGGIYPLYRRIRRCQTGGKTGC